MKNIFAGTFFLILGVFAAVFPIAHASTSSTTPFNTNLSFGMTGSAEVKALQQFLTTQDVYSGPISGNFFTLTMQGVKQFQIMNNIQPSNGYFGPLTRAKVTAIALSENPSIAAASTTITSAPAVPDTSTPSPSLLAYMQMQLNNMFAIVRGLGQRFLGKATSSATLIQPVTISTDSGNSNVLPPSQNVVTPAPTVSTPPPIIVVTPAPAPSVPTAAITSSGSSSSTSQSSGNAMLWGAYVGDIDGTPSLVSSFSTLADGSPDIIATFADLSSGDFPSDEKATVGAQGKTLLLFLEPQYSFDQINSGKYDSILQQYASAAAAYGDPIILAPFDEFNLNENPWGYGVDGNTPTKFIQAWKHVHSFFANDPNVKFALVYNNVSEPADSINTYAAYYPGNAYVDYVAVDGFNFGTTSASAQSFAQIFNPIMPTLESFDKPILFTSIGSLEFPGKAQWISQGLGTYIEQYPNVAGWVYFNYNDTSAGQNWRIDTDPAALAAFQAVIP